MDWKYESGRIYNMDDKGELMAEVTFEDKGDAKINVDHVYVNPVLRGQGTAGKLMLVLVDYLRSNKFKATATCSYANGWFKKNKELYKDIISEEIIDEVIACKINGKH